MAQGSRIGGMMETREMQLLYCKWCPLDCQLTVEEKLGCLASSGFVDDAFLDERELTEDEIGRIIEDCILPEPGRRTYITRIIAKEIAKEIIFKLSGLGIILGQKEAGDMLRG